NGSPEVQSRQKKLLLLIKRSSSALGESESVFFERVFDQGGNAVFEQMNRGKLWKHIILHKIKKKQSSFLRNF
uniref:Complex III subunit 9 n=1 Tax=Oryzias latipes TaxID=8090 RepID=A0A3P9KMJ1_ORYLA